MTSSNFTGGAEVAIEAFTFTLFMITDPSVRAVKMTEISYEATGDVVAVVIIPGGHNVVPRGAVALGAVGAKPFRLLTLTGAKTNGPRRIAVAGHANAVIPQIVRNVRNVTLRCGAGR